MEAKVLGRIPEALVGDPIVDGATSACIALCILFRPDEESIPVVVDKPEYTLPQYGHQN